MTKRELAIRRMNTMAHPNGCAHYFNNRNGDGVYQCMRDGDRRCMEGGCRDYDGPDTGRPLCPRHSECDCCGSVTKKSRAIRRTLDTRPTGYDS